MRNLENARKKYKERNKKERINEIKETIKERLRIKFQNVQNTNAMFMSNYTEKNIFCPKLVAPIKVWTQSLF